MSIYKFAIKKYLKSWSTWIIIAISCTTILSIFSALIFPAYSTFDFNTYTNYYHIGLSAIFVFIIIFGSIFIAFKGVQVFRDELDDGTFLITISKPIKRSSILFWKFLALFTINLLFLAFMVLSYLISILIADKPLHFEITNSILYRNNLAPIVGYTFLLGMIPLIIISSISILISSKFPTGVSIGMTSSIGIIINITSAIGLFVPGSPYVSNFWTIEHNTNW